MDKTSKIIDNPTQTTKLSDLNSKENGSDNISFLDEAKKSHICKISTGRPPLRFQNTLMNEMDVEATTLGKKTTCFCS